MGEGKAGTNDEGLVRRVGESAIRRRSRKCPDSTAGHPQSGPAGLQAPRALLTTATVPLVSQLSRQSRLICPPQYDFRNRDSER